MNKTTLESIMKCSFGYRSCTSIRPRDWEKVLNSAQEKRG